MNGKIPSEGGLSSMDYASVLIDSMMDMVRVIGTDGKVVMMNDAMSSAFGDGVGKTCYCAVGCSEKCEDCMLEKLRDGEGPLTRQRVIGERNFSVKASPLYGSSGEFLGAVEVFRDNTDEVRMRENLLRTNTRLLDDLSMARRLPAAMFRKRFSPMGDFRFTMAFNPCEAVGGDACDLIPLKDGRALLYVADVSGHGVRAAMLTVFLRQEIIMLARQTDRIELHAVLEDIRRSFLEINPHEWTYITIFMAILDTDTGELECVNAGHSVSPVISGEGGAREIFLPGSPVCSWTDHAGGKTGRYTLGSGERLLMYTDGLLNVDREDPEGRIMSSFSAEPFSAPEFIKYFRKLHGEHAEDDLLMFICERTRKDCDV